MESSGLPKSDKAIAYERIWLADDDTLRDEFTLVDPVGAVKPWTVTKTYKRAPPDFEIEPYVCLENNRNPIAPDGSIQAILQSGGKPQDHDAMNRCEIRRDVCPAGRGSRRAGLPGGRRLPGESQWWVLSPWDRTRSIHWRPATSPSMARGTYACFRIRNGRVDYRSRYVRTERYLAQDAARRNLMPMYRNPSRDDPSVKGLSRSTANTHVIHHRNLILALKEDSAPTALDLEHTGDR